MGKWKKWVQVASGPFQGKPENFAVRDMAGNMIVITPDVLNAQEDPINRGGAGIIAHLPYDAWIVRGLDDRLYSLDEEYKWRKLSGPGRLISDAVALGSHDGSREILGEGTEHQLAYCYISNDERTRFEAKNWQSLGRPGEPGGKKGINGRPAVVRGNDGLHVFVRGQDNHLWHILGKYSMQQGGPTFGEWTNLGGRLSSVPVAISSAQMYDKIECFVIGEDNALWTITGDGENWSDFQNLGGQLKGLPAAVNTFTGDSAVVFGRGVDDKLWYRRRNGVDWQDWQSMDGQLTSDPAAANYGEAGLICMALGEKGVLMKRIYIGDKPMPKKIELGAFQYANLFKVTTSDDEVEYWAVDDLTRIPSLRGELNPYYLGAVTANIENVGEVTIPITLNLIAGEVPQGP